MYRIDNYNFVIMEDRANDTLKSLLVRYKLIYISVLVKTARSALAVIIFLYRNARPAFKHSWTKSSFFGR